MITILGGELLCSLPGGRLSSGSLENASGDTTPVLVRVGGREEIFPYHRLDNGPRQSDAAIVIGYLQQVAETLLEAQGLWGSIDPLRTGLFLGSSAIDYSLARPIEEAVDEDFTGVCPRLRVGGGFYLNALQQQLGFTGAALTYNTACSSSANALLGAATLLESRIIDYALVFGLELYSPTTLEGFALMQLLAKEPARPFSADRNGIVLGEAVAVALLSRDDFVPADWRLRGWNSACDTYSVTGADPSGAGFAKVMKAALRSAALPVEDISLVKAHGTASEINDRAEMRALDQIFTDLPPYLSLKPFIGHTLGACGVAELLLLMEAVNAGCVPASLNFSRLEPGFSRPPLTKKLVLENGNMLLNYFGFGGNNSSLVVEKALT